MHDDGSLRIGRFRQRNDLTNTKFAEIVWVFKEESPQANSELSDFIKRARNVSVANGYSIQEGASSKRAGLSMLLGCLAKPDSRSTERTTRKAYHFRLPERDVTARPNIERMQRKRMKAVWM